MSEDTNEIVETPEAPIEETQEQVVEEVEEIADDTPTLEDYERLKKEKETLAAQKEHWRKKAEDKKLEPASDKPTSLDADLIRQEAILYAKGYTEEEVNLAIKLAKINNIPVTKATEDDYLQSKVKARQKKERSEQASLSPSGGVQHQGKDPLEMTPEEHREDWLKSIGAR